MVTLSVPLAQVVKVQVLSEKFVALLMVMSWVPAAPVTARAVAINPAPNCAALTVSVLVPDELSKFRAS